MTLEELIGSILEIDPQDVTDATSQTTLSSWDSMAHINLITAMEEVYNVSFSVDEIQAIKSVGDARQMLRRKGAAV